MKTIRPLDKTEKRGRLLAGMIISVNLLFSILFLLVNLNPLMPLIQFGLSIVLAFGYQGARWVYAGASIFNGLLTLYYLLGGYFTVSRWNFIIILALVMMLLYMLFCGISAVLFYVNQPIKEYMYRKRTDY